MNTNKNIFLPGVTEKYDKRLLEKRMEIEGSVIGAIYSDCLILDEVKLNKNMFISKDGRFYFSLANDLRNKGFNTLDEVTILSNCSDKVVEAFNDRGGFDSISNIMDVVSPSNFDTYIDQLFRENMLCSMYLDGFNLFTEKEIKGKKIITIDLLRRMTCEQVSDYFANILNSYEVGQSSKILEEDYIDFDDEWLKELETGENAGVPYDNCGEDINGETINCYPFLSKQTLGMHNGTLSVMAAFSSTGKSTWIIGLMVAQMHYGRNVLVISNEETKSKFQSKFLCYILSRYNRYYKLSKTKLESGVFNEEDKKQIKIAKEYWKENYRDKCHFVSMNCTDMNVVSKKIREYVLKKGVDFVIFDTFKLADDSFSGERTDLSLVKDSRELFNLARKYQISILATAQLAERFKNSLFLNASHIGGAKAIKEICEMLLEMRRVFPEELDPKSRIYLTPFRRKLVNGKWIEEEYKPDPSDSYAVLFPEKNRNGNDSSNGEAYLLKFVGSQSVFKEVAFCRPKHGLIQ